MWKNDFTKDKAIEMIKNKRKCIEINFGFLFQLSKWEEMIFNLNCYNKIFIFENSGKNVTLIDKNEVLVNIFKNSTSTLLLFHQNKLYKISNIVYNNNLLLNSKIHNFVKLLRTYRKYPSIVESLTFENDRFDVNEINRNIYHVSLKDVFSDDKNLEEINKYSCYNIE